MIHYQTKGRYGTHPYSYQLSVTVVRTDSWAEPQITLFSKWSCKGWITWRIWVMSSITLQPVFDLYKCIRVCPSNGGRKIRVRVHQENKLGSFRTFFIFISTEFPLVIDWTSICSPIPIIFFWAQLDINYSRLYRSFESLLSKLCRYICDGDYTPWLFILFQGTQNLLYLLAPELFFFLILAHSVYIYSPTDRRNRGKPLKRLLDTWDRNGPTSGLTPWQTYYDDDDG